MAGPGYIYLTLLQMDQQQQDYWQSGFQKEGVPPRSSFQPTSDERTMAILSHVLAIFFSFIPPLVIYLIKKDESQWVAEHAKESLNFQITWTLVAIAMAVSIVGLLVIWLVPIFTTIMCILATIKASDNQMYRYPATWRLVK
jgi:uncharacterized Tic20 family protein